LVEETLTEALGSSCVGVGLGEGETLVGVAGGVVDAGAGTVVIMADGLVVFALTGAEVFMELPHPATRYTSKTPVNKTVIIFPDINPSFEKIP
jgi:hypothetical protein